MPSIRRKLLSRRSFGYGLFVPGLVIMHISGGSSGDLVEETTETNEDISTWLEQLRTEHRDLDDVIGYLLENGHSDLMQVQRLKKRKLRLKDMIARLESRLIPDLDA